MLTACAEDFSRSKRGGKQRRLSDEFAVGLVSRGGRLDQTKEGLTGHENTGPGLRVLYLLCFRASLRVGLASLRASAVSSAEPLSFG